MLISIFEYEINQGVFVKNGMVGCVQQDQRSVRVGLDLNPGAKICLLTLYNALPSAIENYWILTNFTKRLQKFDNWIFYICF